MGCVFCDIISGKQKSQRLYEDETVVAILDAFPVTEGHTLVIPRQHAKNMYELQDSAAAHAFLVSRKIARVLQEALKADDINVATAPAAIDHFHIHVVPRYDTDMMGPLADLGNKREMPDKLMEDVAGKIRSALEKPLQQQQQQPQQDSNK